MKNARHEQILQLIQREEIETQEELAEKLNKVGFAVTQATVSRDIRQLELRKVPGRNGRMHRFDVPELAGVFIIGVLSDISAVFL